MLASLSSSQRSARATATPSCRALCIATLFAQDRSKSEPAAHVSRWDGIIAVAGAEGPRQLGCMRILTRRELGARQGASDLRRSQPRGSKRALQSNYCQEARSLPAALIGGPWSAESFRLAISLCDSELRELLPLLALLRGRVGCAASVFFCTLVEMVTCAVPAERYSAVHGAVSVFALLAYFVATHFFNTSWQT